MSELGSSGPNTGKESTHRYWRQRAQHTTWTAVLNRIQESPWIQKVLVSFCRHAEQRNDVTTS